jgi:hypothetical protein
MRRSTVLLAAIAMAIGAMAAPAAAGGHEPHSHVLLLNAEWEGEGPGTLIHSFDRCVELAAGQSLRMRAHHANIHTGRAGGALASAGHLVAPIPSCAAAEQAVAN